MGAQHRTNGRHGKYIAASIAARVQRLLDKKRAKNRAVTEMTAIYLQTPKAAAAKPRPVQPPTPTTPAEDNSSDSSSEVSEVSGESQLEGEGVGEAIGVIRSCQDKGESLWTPGVVCRLFGTPEFPHRVFRKPPRLLQKSLQQQPPRPPLSILREQPHLRTQRLEQQRL